MAVFVEFYTRSHECVSVTPCVSITYNSIIIDEIFTFFYQIQITANSTLTQQLTQRQGKRNNKLQFQVCGYHDPAPDPTTPAHVIM